MPDPIDTLELQLLEAGRRLQRSRWSSWRMRLGRRAQLTTVALAAAVVVTPAVAAVTETWPGDADRGTPDAPRIQIPVSDAALDATLRDAFSVLRRDPEQGDTLPAHATLPPIVRGVQTRSARRLLETREGGVYLVPVDAVLPKPLQVLSDDERVGPPGICAAMTADAPAVFSCAPTRQLLGPGAGLSLQTAACVPGAPAGTVSLQGLAVDQVSGLEVQLADGAVVPVSARANLVDARFSDDRPPRQVRWDFNGRHHERMVVAPPRAGPCAQASAP